VRIAISYRRWPVIDRLIHISVFALLAPRRDPLAETVSVAGRVHARRDASSKLIFFDVECGLRERSNAAQFIASPTPSASAAPVSPEAAAAAAAEAKGSRVQIMFTQKQYSASNVDIVTDIVRRGDIIGTHLLFPFSFCQSIHSVYQWSSIFDVSDQSLRVTRNSNHQVCVGIRAERRRANSALCLKRSHCSHRVCATFPKSSSIRCVDNMFHHDSCNDHALAAIF
jgi:hypothetical protein